MHRLLIEEENRYSWRVVERECTPRGFSSTRFNVLKQGLKFSEAKDRFIKMKYPTNG